MKKITLLFAVMCLTLVASAQDQGTFRAQAGLEYGGDTEFGINGGVQYFVADNIAVAPSYSIFLKDFGGIKFSSLNLEGRYYFNEGIYGLAGFDILRASANGASISNSELAVGAGYDLSLSDGTLLNLQAKYADQIVIGAGVIFSF